MSDTSLKRLAYYLGFSKPRGALLLGIALIAGGAGLAYLLPRQVDIYIPGGAPVVQIFLELLWLWLMVWGLLGHRRIYREQFGERAYRKMAERYFLWAVLLMFNGVLRPIWVAGDAIAYLPLWLKILLGSYLVLMGVLLERKGIKALGIDQVVLIYTVFPERARQVQSALYQYLRHPLYAALMHLGLGVAIFSGTYVGLLVFLIFGLKLWIWSKIEEKELIEKFGKGYAAYRKRVPAFIPRWRSTRHLLLALLDRH